MLSYRFGDCFAVVILLALLALLQVDTGKLAAMAAPSQKYADGETNGYERLKSLLETLRDVRTKYHQLKEHQNTLNDIVRASESEKREISKYSHQEREISDYSQPENARESARSHKSAEEEEEKDFSAQDAKVDELRAAARDVVMARIVALLDKATSEQNR